MQANIKEKIKTPHYWPFVKRIHRLPMDSPHKGPVTRKIVLFYDVIMCRKVSSLSMSGNISPVVTWMDIIPQVAEILSFVWPWKRKAPHDTLYEPAGLVVSCNSVAWFEGLFFIPLENQIRLYSADTLHVNVWPTTKEGPGGDIASDLSEGNKRKVLSYSVPIKTCKQIPTSPNVD